MILKSEYDRFLDFCVEEDLDPEDHESELIFEDQLQDWADDMREQLELER